ncbi:MAG: hypothetical protein FWF84_07195 [Kiritimatiellaeota bacterium]|nr:hypothetical protein [Kiritimatiellota bacterium]
MFKGKSGYIAAFIISFAVIFGVIAGQALGEGFSIAKMIFNGEIEYATYANIPQILWYLLFNDSEFLRGTFVNLGLGLVFAFLGAKKIITDMIAMPKPVKDGENNETHLR